MTLLHADATFAVADRHLQVALEVARGEVLALVGGNGAGKSSIVDALAGLGTHVDGEVRRDEAAGLGWAPQSAGLLPRLKVRRQVGVFARPDRSPLLAGAGTIDHLLTALGIAHLADRRPDGLSGGEAQRVAVARALAAGALVLLDEPMSAQDPDGALAVRRAIEAHRAAGGGALVVTHRLDDAWLVAGRACLVEDLATTRCGPPASFGTAVLRGHVGADHLLRGEDGDLVVPDDVAPGPAIAVVRAETVTLHRTVPAGSSARNVVRAVVDRIDDVEGRLHVTLDAMPALVAALTRTAVEELDLAPGTTVWATCKASDVHVHRT